MVNNVRHVRGEIGEELNKRAIKKFSVSIVHASVVSSSGRHGQGHDKVIAIAAIHTILKDGGPIKLDHDLVRIFIFLHVTHFAQALGLHQRSVLAISLRGGWVPIGGRTQ